MCFTIIRDKLGSYASETEFFQDIESIWSNCYLYNIKKSLVSRAAQKLETLAHSL